MGYSIRQVVQRTGIPASTLRFYEAKGLLAPVGRNGNGVREYTDADLERLGSITCLKNTRMPIEEIRRFMELCGQGDATLQKRRDMVRILQELEAGLSPRGIYADELRAEALHRVAEDDSLLFCDDEPEPVLQQDSTEPF